MWTKAKISEALAVQATVSFIQTNTNMKDEILLACPDSIKQKVIDWLERKPIYFNPMDTNFKTRD
jgi:hypothetical protein